MWHIIDAHILSSLEKKNCSQFNATKEGPKKKYLQLFSLISFKKNDNVIFL